MFFNCVIQSFNTVFVLFLLLFTGKIPVVLYYRYWLLPHLIPMTGMMHVNSIYAFCLLMLPPRGIVLSQCGCHHSFMPVTFSCSPQRVLVLMCCQNCPFSFTLKTLKTGIRFKIWLLIGQHLEICVCPWEPARSFHEIFPLADWSKINLCQ